MKFYPYTKKRGGGRQSLTHPEGGGAHTKFWGSFNTDVSIALWNLLSRQAVCEVQRQSFWLMFPMF